MPRNTSPAWITRFVTFVVALVVMTTTAWAQDYTVTQGTGRLEVRPTGATKLPLDTGAAEVPATIDLPFEFAYYGTAYSRIDVLVHGFVLPGSGHVLLNADSPGGNHGQDFTTEAFPYSTNGRVSAPGVADTDGLIAPLWARYGNISGANPTGGVYSWVVGTAPNRRLVVSWDNVRIDTNASENITVQVHLYEGTGRIVFAYSNTTLNAGYGNTKYVCGLDAPLESRFTVPLANSRTNTGYPGSDFIFDPRTVTFTGKLTYDKLVSDSTGIGGTIASGQPLGGFRVELRRDGSTLANAVTTASDGTFSIPALGTLSTSTGSIHVIATNSVCRVLQGGTPSTVTTWNPVSNLSFSSGSALGTLALNATTDSAGSLRSAFNAAIACTAARAWAAPRTNASLPFLDVLLDDAAVGTSVYQSAAGTAPALLVIAGKASSNQDSWDDAIIAKLYARHVLAAIAASPTATYDDRFDASTSAQNAFAEAFGYVCAALMTGKATVVDGTGATTAIVRNLETPGLTVARNDTVTGAVTAALFDLTDAANETIDTVDGTPEPDAFFRIIDSMTSAPTAVAFLQAWADAGKDAVALTRGFIGNGLVADDAVEPNDSATETELLGALGTRRTGFLLNRYSEDWFRFTVADPVPSVTVDATWQRSSISAQVTLEVSDSSGNRLASGAFVGTTGPLRATTGPLPAGTYRVRVRHDGGAPLPTYEVQAFKPLTLSSTPFRDWTAGQDYDIPVGVDGGVAPYTFSFGSSGLPPGLAITNTLYHGAGKPSEPGTYNIQITAKDAALPQNSAVASQVIRIAPPVDVALAPFVGFPLGLAIDTTLPVTGGTPPLDLDLVGGMLPEGLSIDGAFRVTGTASIAGATPFELEATDVASSTESAAVRGVVCPQGLPKNLLVDLAAGDAACGFWIDAVQGSTLRFSAKTKPKAVKRALTVTVLGPDRLAIAGLKVKAPLGGASCASIPCAKSGRYYVILSSASGEATQLITAIAAVPPKSGKVLLDDVTPADGPVSVTFGAFAGAKVTFRATPAKKSDLTASFAALVGPDGTALIDGVVAKPSGAGFIVTATLPDSGTWTVLVNSGPPSATAADVSVSYTLKQPKSGAFEADE